MLNFSNVSLRPIEDSKIPKTDRLAVNVKSSIDIKID